MNGSLLMEKSVMGEDKQVYETDSSRDDAAIRGLEGYLDNMSHITIYVTSFLALIGLTGNFISLVIFVNADKHLPRIASKNYLMLLTVVNTTYLIMHWYNSTYTRIMINYKVFVDWDFFNTNSMVCRSVGFVKSLCRMLSVLLTLTFSLERLLVIYFPLKVMYIKRHFIKIFRLDILILTLISVALTIYIFILTEPVPFESSRIELDNGRKTNFSKYSLIPITTSLTHCSVPERNTELFFRIYGVNVIVLLAAYFVTSISLIIIVIKLTNEPNFVFVYKTRRLETLDELRNTERKSMFLDEQLEQELDQDQQSYEQNVQFRAPNQHSLICEDSWKNESIINQQRPTVRYTFNKKFQNSVMLVTLAFFFLVLNLPYNLGILIGQAYFQKRPINDDKKMYQLYLRTSMFVYIAEILMFCNYSLTGLLFFCSGKIFRLHFYQLCKRATR